MTQEEFCRLTGIDELMPGDFRVINTLFEATDGSMPEWRFCEQMKEGLQRRKNGRLAPFIWMIMVADTLKRQKNRIKELQAAVKDLEEAMKKREEEILAAGRNLRWIAGKRGLKDLAEIAIAVDLIGAERSARYAVEKGLVLHKEEEQAVKKAMEELTDLRELRKN